MFIPMRPAAESQGFATGGFRLTTLVLFIQHASQVVQYSRDLRVT